MATRVVVAGGGVAALEAALALRELAEERVEIELVGPEPHFWYRPLSVAEPFGLGRGEPLRAGRAGAPQARRAHSVRSRASTPTRHEAKTSVGAIPYDACWWPWARPDGGCPGALTSAARPTRRRSARCSKRSPPATCAGSHCSAVGRGLVAAALRTGADDSRYLGRTGSRGRADTRHPRRGAAATLWTAGSTAVGELLDERGIALVTASHPVELTDGRLRLVPEAKIEVDRVVALPRLRGRAWTGCRRRSNGFIPIDAHGRVRGLDDVYAAGDITNYPVKQGGIATQLADAAAEVIAQAAGADLRPEPFRPVLRGLLLTGSQPRYLRRELTAPTRSTTAARSRFGGRRRRS